MGLDAVVFLPHTRVLFVSRLNSFSFTPRPRTTWGVTCSNADHSFWGEIFLILYFMSISHHPALPLTAPNASSFCVLFSFIFNPLKHFPQGYTGMCISVPSKSAVEVRTPVPCAACLGSFSTSTTAPRFLEHSAQVVTVKSPPRT